MESIFGRGRGSHWIPTVIFVVAKVDCTWPPASWLKVWECMNKTYGVELQPKKIFQMWCVYGQVKEQREGLSSTLGRGRGSLCLQNPHLSFSVLKVKFFICNSTLFFLDFGKSFGKGKHMRQGTVVIMFDSFWMTTKSFMEWPCINSLYELIGKTKTVKGFSKANKIANSKFDFFLFFFFGHLGFAPFLCQMKDH